MSEKGRDLPCDVYGVLTEKIETISHGIPDSAFVEPDAAKATLGFSRKSSF
jgi:hypothetical protein